MASKQKYSYYIGVIMNDGTLRFVTGLHSTEKYAMWNVGEEVKEFSMSVADDIVFGLLMNFHYAFTVKVPYGIKFYNPKDKESEEK